MSRRVLCKFFMHGACLKGEHCEFSHDWKDQENNVCTFYQKGACSYGSRCRYDHVKVSRNRTPAPSSSNTGVRAASDSFRISSPSAFPGYTDYQPAVNTQTQQLSKSNLVLSSAKPAWTKDIQEARVSDDWSGYYHSPRAANQTNQIPSRSLVVPPSETEWPKDVNEDSVSDIWSGYTSDQGARHNASFGSPADLPICSFAAAGKCPYGDNCLQMHGDLCDICGKQCLHPYRPEEREEHIKLCESNNKRLEALKRSQEIECSVCLDRVLSKPTAAERKFGLLSECDHPFCVSCIRNWRSNSPSSGMDVNSALRSCPICRKLSYYVIPSVLWYFSKEEKQEIIDSYKSKLKSIDCKYFDFGTGTCPFGTSCFYKHAYRDGRLEEVCLRHLDAEDGSTHIAKNIRLSDFLFSQLRL